MQHQEVYSTISPNSREIALKWLGAITWVVGSFDLVIAKTKFQFNLQLTT